MSAWFDGNEVNVNTILIVVGWLVGGLVVIVGMRGQIVNLTNELKHNAGETRLLREALSTINGRLDVHATEIAYLRGRADERAEKLKV